MAGSEGEKLFNLIISEISEQFQPLMERSPYGSTFEAETDMIPLVWRGYPVAYHFVREVEAG